MDFIETIKHRQTLSTEQLLDEFSRRINLDADNQSLFSMLGMALLAHSGDTRRTHDSCLEHVIRVSLMVGDLSQNALTLMKIGLLHDLVEDYPEYIRGPKEDVWSSLEQDYGKEICETLKILTNPPEVELEEHQDQEPVLYHAHIEHILHNPNAALVKLADFTDNLMTVSLSDDQSWKDELWLRYFPVIPQFEKAFQNKPFTEALGKYFKFIQDKR